MPGESIVVKIAADDGYSEVMKKLSAVTKAFDKDVDALEDALINLSKQKAPLSAALKGAQKELAATTEQFNSSGDAVSRMTMEMAQVKVDTIRRNLSLVSKAAKDTEKQFTKLGESSRKSGERMKLDGAEIARAFSSSGFKDMLADLGKSVSTAWVGSAFGNDAGNIFSGVLGGVGSGAMLGTMLFGPGLGTAIGAAAGGVVGGFSGTLQNQQAKNDAFKSYYTGLYDTTRAETEKRISSGSVTAGQREKDMISFTTLFGDEQKAESYLSGLVDMANTTPFLYSDLTAMSKTLATYGYGADQILPTLQTVGDTGAALGMSVSDMNAIATALGRMESSDKATLEYLNILNDRGVGAVGYLAEAKGLSVGETYSAISKGEISGTETVKVILDALERDFSGSMREQSQTFEGLSSTLEGLKQEIDNAAGEGYNRERTQGLNNEIDTYGGALGQAMKEASRISGENAAYMENLKEQYRREALASLLLGETAKSYTSKDQEQLAGMREEYLAAQAAYDNEENSDKKQMYALKMEELQITAEGMATAAYEASEQYKLAQDTEKEALTALRENTSALVAASAAYSLAQERTKGMLGGDQGGTSDSETPGGLSKGMQRTYDYRAGAGSGRRGRPNAHGLNRVPYDDYPALLHEGERVLTAREARAQDRAGPGISITVSGNTFGAGLDETAVAQALADQIALQLKAGGGR